MKWLILAALVGSAHAADAPKPTPQQIRACTPDAQRFCPEFISLGGALPGMDECMMRHKAQFSRQCREATK